jgi:hypothetical protein
LLTEQRGNPDHPDARSAQHAIGVEQHQDEASRKLGGVSPSNTSSKSCTAACLTLRIGERLRRHQQGGVLRHLQEPWHDAAPLRYGPLAYVPIHRRLPLTWPNGARVALWVNPNVEFFGLDDVMPSNLNDRVPREQAKIPNVRNWAHTPRYIGIMAREPNSPSGWDREFESGSLQR